MSFEPAGVVAQFRRLVPVDGDGDAFAMCEDGHSVPVLRSKPLLHVFRSGLADPRAPVGLVKSARVLLRINLGLKSRDAAKALFLDAKIKATVALDGLVIQAHGEVGKDFVADEVAEILVGRHMGGVNRTVLDFPVTFADAVPPVEVVSVPQRLPLVVSQVLQADVAEADLQSQLVRGVNLQADEAFERFRVHEVRRRHAVDPRLDGIARHTRCDICSNRRTGTPGPPANWWRAERASPRRPSS